MANKTLLERFTELANSRKAEIVELQHMYLLKQIENEVVQECFKEVYNKVLAENPFYSDRECERSRSGNKISKGDRILLSDDQWLMSTEDYALYANVSKELPFAFIVSSFTAVVTPLIVQYISSGEYEKFENLCCWSY